MKMDYSLKILSPVHIGCGEQYTGLNFILDGSKIYVVTPETIIALLGPQKGLKFAEWLEVNANEIARLDSDQKSKKDESWKERDRNRKKELEEKATELKRKWTQKKNNFNLRSFVNSANLVSIGQLTENAVYSVSCIEGNSRLNELNPFIKQMTKPYIPGTEIKGAIRTTILYCAICDNVGLRNWLQQALDEMLNETVEKFQGRIVATYRDYVEAVKNQKKPDKRKKDKLVERIKKIESDLQDKVFNSNIQKPDAKFDVMKFMQVGDTPLLDTGKALAVSYVEPYNISTKFRVFYEYLRPELQVTLTSFTLEPQGSRNMKLKKMGFSETHKKMVGGMEAILACCHRFAADLLAEEIAYFSQYGKTEIVDHLKEIQNLNTPKSPVLRIGKDEGYNSLTVGLAVKKLMPDLYKNVLIHATKNKSYDSDHGGLFPKSRKIVHWGKQEVTSGWVQLIPNIPAKKDQIPKMGQTESSDLRKPPMPADLSALQNKFGGRRR
jgi:CRISPR-associated protein Csm5